jgi:hypothetical protein
MGARLTGVVLMALTFYAVIFCWVRPQIFWANSDFACFYRAGKMVAVGDGARVYDFGAQRTYDARWRSALLQPNQQFRPMPYAFAPFSLWLFAPLGRLPYAMAERVWYAVNVSLLLATVFLLHRRLAFGRGLLFAALLLPPFFVPVVLALLQGQPSIVLLFLFTLAFLCYRLGLDVRCGCLLAFCTIKPQFVVPLLLALALTRKWRIVGGFLAMLPLLLLAAVPLVGWRAAAAYPRALQQVAAVPGVENLWAMPNLRGLFYNLLHTRLSTAHLQEITLGVSAAAVLVLLLVFRQVKPSNRDLGFSLGIAMTLLAGYHGYLHDWSLLLLPFLLILARVRDGRVVGNPAACPVLITAMIVLPLCPTTFPHMVIGLCGLLLLFILAVAGEILYPRQALLGGGNAA